MWPMKFKKILEYFQNEIEWQHHVDGVERLGPQLDGRGERFMKSKLLEECLCLCVKRPKDMVWVDKCGRDLYIKSLDVFVEAKFHKYCMYTLTGKRKKTVGRGVKLYNSNGTNSLKCLPNKYASSVLLLESRGAALMRKPDCSMLNFKGDSIRLNGLEWDETNILFGFNDFEPSVRYENMTHEEQNCLTDILEDIPIRFFQTVIQNSKLTNKGKKCQIE